jgi:uncharacterized protein
MEILVTTDLAHVARDLGLPVEQVKKTVELLDEGNTVPFITRFRKDQTGGFDEEQIRHIQAAVGKARMLAERKQTILKSIDSQGKLTKELSGQIKGAQSTKRLEDLYLPYKPKKQTLATVARQRGLQSLTDEVLSGSPLAVELDLRAGDYLNPDLGLFARADVLLGVGHLLAETFSERADLRSKLRKIFRATGRLVSHRVPPPEKAQTQTSEGAAEAPADKAAESRPPAEDTAQRSTEPDSTGEPATKLADTSTPDGPPASAEPDQGSAEQEAAQREGVEQQAVERPATDQTARSQPGDDSCGAEITPETTSPEEEAAADATASQAPGSTGSSSPEETPADAGVPSTPKATGDVKGTEEVKAAGTADSGEASADQPGPAEKTPPGEGTVEPVAQSVPAPPRPKKEKKKKSKKDREREKKEKAFKDYFDFQEDLSRLMPHRILAINRGERAKVLRVRIEADTDQMTRESEKLLIPADHPHADFLKGVIRDALTRLLMPSLEREIRRELTDKAEAHAVEVFARNLRHLLLTPPLHGHRVLAIDPGFRSGCKMAALDEFGNVLGHGVIHFVGREERRRKARYRLAEIIRLHRLSVVGIGNGSACREVEQLVADVIANELKDLDVQYCIVNEAGASVYSTSGIGREELPDYDATLRSAVSIGRRLLDPLSELVKINPSNIGVGLYQHDVKVKHLRESLDAVVESCVNYVGVDVNTASPALLRYVSGLNQLTARRLYDYRLQNGPFKNREQLQNVPGFGTATYVQAAGFLKIRHGDNPLDATWIHPESYDTARRVLKKLDISAADLPVDEQEGKVIPPVRQEPVPPQDEPPPGDSAAAMPADEAPAETVPGPELPTPEATTKATTEATRPVEAKPSPEDKAADAVPGVEPGADASLAETAATAEVTAEVQTPEPPVEGESGAEGPPTPAAVAEAESAAAAESLPAQPASPQPAAAEPPPGEPPPGEPLPAEARELGPTRLDFAKRVAEVDVDPMAQELGIGKLLLRDILSSLARPTRDPRDDLPRPIFRRGIVKLDDLQPGMDLAGTVLNVVDFGAFIDIGLNDSALIHVSRLADRYVRDPHDVVSVGDVIRVWVVDVDKQRRRVSLTAIRPGTERPHSERRGRRAKDKKKPDRPPRDRDKSRKPEGGAPSKRVGGRGRREFKKPVAKPRYKRKEKPKPVVPITKAMKEGREPMRTFGDLQQFWQIQQTGNQQKEKKKQAESPQVEPKQEEERQVDSPQEEEQKQVESKKVEPQEEPPKEENEADG